MPLFRIALSVLLAGALALLTATPALAHTTLKSSNPANGSSLDAAPDAVTLTFEEAVTLPNDPISVTGPDGASWTVGTPAISGASVTAPVTATGPAGKYTLRYTVTADDGDAVKGAVTFTLAAAATPASEAAAPASAEAQAGAPAAAPVAAPATTAPINDGKGSDTGTPTWVWVVVAIVVLGIAGGAVAAVQRRRTGSGGRTSPSRDSSTP